MNRTGPKKLLAVSAATIAIAAALFSGCAAEKPSYPRVWKVTPTVLGLSAVRETAEGVYEVQTADGWKQVLRTDSDTNYGTRACQVTFWKDSVGMWTFTKDSAGRLHYPNATVDGPEL